MHLIVIPSVIPMALAGVPQGAEAPAAGPAGAPPAGAAEGQPGSPPPAEAGKPPGESLEARLKRVEEELARLRLERAAEEEVSGEGGTEAPASPGPMASLASALNPSLTFVANALARVDDRKAFSRGGDRIDNQVNVREAEIDARAAVDPYADGVLILSFESEFPGDASAGVEEGYVTIKSLPFLERPPLGLKVRAGRFRPAFGKINLLHTHDLPQSTRPLAVAEFLGQEGFSANGGSAEFFIPTPWDPEGSTDLTLQAMSAGEAAAAEDARSGFAFLGHLRWFRVFHDAHTFDVGASGYVGPTEPDRRRDILLGGLDAFYKWKPLRAGEWKSFLLGGELFAARASSSGGRPESSTPPTAARPLRSATTSWRSTSSGRGSTPACAGTGRSPSMMTACRSSQRFPMSPTISPSSCGSASTTSTSGATSRVRTASTPCTSSSTSSWARTHRSRSGSTSEESMHPLNLHLPSPRTRHAPRIAVAAAAAAALLRPGPEPGREPGPEEPQKLMVVCTLTTLESLVREVGGDRVETASLAKGDQDPHFVSPTPVLMQKTRRADLFVELGMSLELWAAEVVRGSGNPGIPPGDRAG